MVHFTKIVHSLYVDNEGKVQPLPEAGEWKGEPTDGGGAHVQQMLCLS